MRSEFPLGNSCNQLSLKSGGHFPLEKSATNHTRTVLHHFEKNKNPYHEETTKVGQETDFDRSESRFRETRQMEWNGLLRGQKKMLAANKWTYQIQRNPDGHQSVGLDEHRFNIQGIVLWTTRVRRYNNGL